MKPEMKLSIITTMNYHNSHPSYPRNPIKSLTKTTTDKDHTSVTALKISHPVTPPMIATNLSYGPTNPLINIKLDTTDKLYPRQLLYTIQAADGPLTLIDHTRNLTTRTDNNTTIVTNHTITTDTNETTTTLKTDKKTKMAEFTSSS